MLSYQPGLFGIIPILAELTHFSPLENCYHFHATVTVINYEILCCHLKQSSFKMFYFTSLCVCVYMCLQRPEESTRFLGAGVTGVGTGAVMWYRKANSGPLEKKQAHNPEPSLQPSYQNSSRSRKQFSSFHKTVLHAHFPGALLLRMSASLLSFPI